jgi:drug/metabolite transporter (DMT)-like permease
MQDPAVSPTLAPAPRSWRLSPGVIHILLATLFFAVMNAGVKLVPRIPVHEIVLFRALVTLVIGYLALRFKGVSPWGNHKPLLLLRGLVGTCALVMYFYTLHQMPLATAVTVQYLSPIFTVLVSAVLLKEPPRPIQLPFFAIATLGVALVKGFDAAVPLSALMVGVASAFCSGIAYNVIRKLKDHDHPLVVVFYFPMVTVPIVGPYTLTHWVWPGPFELGVLVSIGLVTTVAQIFLTRAFQADRAANVSLFNYLGLVYALLIGVAFFGEIPTLLGLVGLALIVVGVVLGTRFNPHHGS